ncbi:MAG: decaprenyl-phosphate phosphoribosyltransferase [Acidimicrobiia bacterium]
MSRRSRTPAPPVRLIETAPEAPPRGRFARALWRTARPKQWVKNVLVFAAPGAAGQLSDPTVLAHAGVAFVAFCLASSGTYFWNDAVDAEADRLHPTKRRRPVAAGELGVGAAKVAGTILLVLALAVSLPIEQGRLALAVGAYIVLTFSYSLWLKHEPVLDLAAVAAGFVLRAIAGGLATDIVISEWFLVVTTAGSLFMVTGKRHAEVLDRDTDGVAHRRVLSHYPTGFLNYVRAVTSGVAVTAYCLWAFDKAKHGAGTSGTWFELSIVPFVLALMRYALLVEQGRGGAPEEVVLGDRTICVLGVLWIAVFAIGLHVA